MPRIIQCTQKNCMKHRPSWGACRCSSGQEIPRPLWNHIIYYPIHMTLPLIPILNQLNPIPTLTLYSFKINFNIVLPSMPRSPKWALPFSVLRLILYKRFSFPHSCYISCPSHNLDCVITMSFLPRQGHLCIYLYSHAQNCCGANFPVGRPNRKISNSIKADGDWNYHI
jgi:hypothetical protein